MRELEDMKAYARSKDFEAAAAAQPNIRPPRTSPSKWFFSGQGVPSILVARITR